MKKICLNVTKDDVCDVPVEPEPDCEEVMKLDASDVVEIPIPFPVDYDHAKLKNRDKADQHPIDAISGLREALSGGSITPEERAKLAGIEAGAQVNKIEVIKVNGELIPVSDKTVDIVKDFAGELSFDTATRELSLLADDGTLLSTVTIPGKLYVGDEITIHVNDDTISIHPDIIAEIEATETGLANHILAQDNPHKVTAAQVGLDKVDNTSDADKPISTAAQAAIDAEASARASADSALEDKITDEVAAREAGDSAVQGAIDTHVADVANPHKVTKTQVGLGNVDNTADADKPVSTAQQTALDAKLNKDFTTDVLTGADVTGDNTQVKITVDKVNPSSGVVGQFEKTFPVADTSKMGMMAPEQVAQINANTADIEALKGRSIRYKITLSGATTQDLLTAAYLDRTPRPPVPPLDGTTLVNTVDNKEFTWFTTENKWIDRGVTVVSLATNTSPGIVQGSLDKFKSQIEGDGTMSVNGLDELEDAVNNSKQVITDHVASKANPHGVTKAQVGLGLVDNTSDAQKPISNATQDALDTKASTESVSALEATVATVKGTADAAMPKAGGTFTGPITINGGDNQGIILPENANINTTGNRTVFGFLNGNFTVNYPSYGLKFRGAGANPDYNDKPIALKSDIPSVTGFATKTELEEGLATKQPTGDYATKTELAGKQDAGDYALNSKVDAIAPTASFDNAKRELTVSVNGKSDTVVVPGGESVWGGITGDINNQSDLIDELTAKLDIAQSTADAGKFIQVGTDGNLVPANVPAPEEVKWGNLKGQIADQTDLQTELDGKATTGAVASAQSDATQALKDAKKANDALPNKADKSQFTPINSAIDALKAKDTEQDGVIADKVDKVPGKGLSTNDYTTTEKNKLDGIADNAQANVIEEIKKNGVKISPVGKSVDISIPVKTSDIRNDSDFTTNASVNKKLGDKANQSALDATNAEVAKKVDKVTGKGLSDQNYTIGEKQKLEGISAGAQVNIIESISVNENPVHVDKKSVNIHVPTTTSELTNDSNFATNAYVDVAVRDKATTEALGAETTAREQADTGLQSQIDAIVARADVVDIVATKAKLDEYATGALSENDIIKVLKDETHANASTYYRWVKGAWVYIGEDGEYYTKSAADAQFVPQTRTVNKKALTGNIELTASDVNALDKTGKALTAGRADSAEKDLSGNVITTHYATKAELAGKQDAGSYQPAGDYATKTELSEGLATKQKTGDYATNTALTQGLAKKQDVGDYATNDDLTKGLATKQPVGDYQSAGDYATNTALNGVKATAEGAVKKSGDTMTGALTVGQSKLSPNGYVESTWLKTTGATKLGSVPDKIAVIDPSGWVYYNDKAQLKEALGVNGKQDAGDYALKSDLTAKLDKVGGQAEYGMAKGARQVRNVILETADPSASDCQNGDVWANYGDTPDVVVKMHDAWTKVADVTTVVQDANGVTINGTALQDASETQDGLMTKELVQKVNTALSTKVRVLCKPNATVTATEQGGTGKQTANGGSRGLADFNGLALGSTWKFETGGQSETVKVDTLYQEVDLTPIVYGFCIDESISDPSDRVTYTDKAIGIQPAKGLDLGGWANTPLFQGIKPVVRMSNGTFKDLNKRDLTKCVDGSPSNILTLGNDAFAEFPTWYIHMHAEGKKKYVKISQEKKDSTYHAMHAMDNGTLRNCFHVGCFGSYNSGNKIYSSSGKTPTTNISTQNYALYCQARGKGYDQFSWFPWNFICALFILAYKTCNSQAVFRGYVDGRSSVQAENRTSFDNDFGLAGSSSGTEQMSFLWIQNLWGNMYQFIGGAKTNGNNQLMVILDGKDCTTNESDFTTVGSGGQTSGIYGYVSEMDLSSSKVGFFPKVASGSSTTHWCDDGYVYPSNFPRCGGNYRAGDSAGLFYVGFDYSASNTSSNIGSRLMYKGGRP